MERYRMTEQRTTDWKGPVALVLAGLALLVALSGRGFPFGSHFDGPRSMVFRAEAAPLPVPPVTAVPADPMPPLYGMTVPVPMVPGDPELREGLREKWYEMWGESGGRPFRPGHPEPPLAPVPAPGGYYFDSGGNVLDDAWNYVRGAYYYFQPLLQLGLVVLLAVVLFTWLRRRERPAAYPAGYNPAYPAQPQVAPPTGQDRPNDTPSTGYPGPGVLD
jgi:hypothetical protein